MTPDEVRAILAELAARFGEDLNVLWSNASGMSSEEFRALIAEAYPELVLPYSALASEVGAQWYDSTPSDTAGYVVQLADLPTAERLNSSAVWALNNGSGEGAISLLHGAGERAIFDGLRDTIDLNVESEPGALWARHASANACSFCRIMATRGAVYRSAESAGTVVGRSLNLTVADQRAIAMGTATKEELLARRETYAIGRRKALRGTAKYGAKYHDNCHCMPVMVRPGQSYTPPPYVAQWEKDYQAAWNAVPDGTSYDDNGVLKAIISHMDGARK